MHSIGATRSTETVARMNSSVQDQAELVPCMWYEHWNVTGTRVFRTMDLTPHPELDAVDRTDDLANERRKWRAMALTVAPPPSSLEPEQAVTRLQWMCCAYNKKQLNQMIGCVLGWCPKSKQPECVRIHTVYVRKDPDLTTNGRHLLLCQLVEEFRWAMQHRADVDPLADLSLPAAALATPSAIHQVDWTRLGFAWQAASAVWHWSSRGNSRKDATETARRSALGYGGRRRFVYTPGSSDHSFAIRSCPAEIRSTDRDLQS